MDFTLDILQGAGLAAAIGIRPFLPTLLTGALAAADAGLDFEGTDFAFVESWPFLLTVLVLVMLADLASRRAGRDEADSGVLGWTLLGLSAALGALVAAASLADRSDIWWPGLAVGAACAALGCLAARSLFGRVRARLDAAAAAALPVYAEGSALLVAGLAVLFPPLSLPILVVLLWLLAAGRRRQGAKYAGLRILR